METQIISNLSFSKYPWKTEEEVKYQVNMSLKEGQSIVKIEETEWFWDVTVVTKNEYINKKIEDNGNLCKLYKLR